MGWGRRKLCNEEFDDLCVGKDDEVMECKVDSRVTYWSKEKLIVLCNRTWQRLGICEVRLM